ncbi:hypothetical protein BT96DRAFT_990198 [Gymnopus androsaceus JB14]|uniref:Uncharacterized protein n=1 Tax=Gymnopus androsaceus JB14 TaxID=1447944 RepID=A0A6A4I3W7_9AGAR|nr:hypothetical protein BT96DRAFT_990198 [Gymnopus androsaceus JB14]
MSSPSQQGEQSSGDTKMDNGHANGQQITDPILPISTHDWTNVELEQIPPPYSDSQVTEGMDKKEVNNQCHVGMEQVVWEETSKGWWEEDTSGQTCMAIVAAVSVSIGGYSTFILSKTLGRVFGSSGGSGIINILIGSIGCTLLALAAAFIVLHQDTKEEQKG